MKCSAGRKGLLFQENTVVIDCHECADATYQSTRNLEIILRRVTLSFSGITPNCLLFCGTFGVDNQPMLVMLLKVIGIYK